MSSGTTSFDRQQQIESILRAALQLAEKSVETDPASARARGDLALRLNKVGDMLMAGDDAAAALEHYR